MRVRDWQDILSDVTESDVDPDGWRAVAGDRRQGVGEDFYLGHPAVGVYQLKTYSKNPQTLRGVGAQVARRIDDELDPLLPDQDQGGRFAVRQPPESEGEAKQMAKHLQETLRVHAEAPTHPEDLFEDVMDALDSPAWGPMEYEFTGRPDRLDELSNTFEDAERLLDSELDDIIDEDDVGRGFQ